MSGLIDRLFPPLDALDQALSGVLPPLVRLVLYGAASGAITMVVYRLTSDQNGILALKERMRDLRGQLKVAADDFAQTMQLSRENFASMQQPASTSGSVAGSVTHAPNAAFKKFEAFMLQSFVESMFTKDNQTIFGEGIAKNY